jgi:hypothetical protein
MGRYQVEIDRRDTLKIRKLDEDRARAFSSLDSAALSAVASEA